MNEIMNEWMCSSSEPENQPPLPFFYKNNNHNNMSDVKTGACWLASDNHFCAVRTSILPAFRPSLPLSTQTCAPLCLPLFINRHWKQI
jgi:hypothetical protein